MQENGKYRLDIQIVSIPMGWTCNYRLGSVMCVPGGGPEWAGYSFRSMRMSYRILSQGRIVGRVAAFLLKELEFRSTAEQHASNAGFSAADECFPHSIWSVHMPAMRTLIGLDVVSLRPPHGPDYRFIIAPQLWHYPRSYLVLLHSL